MKKILLLVALLLIGCSSQTPSPPLTAPVEVERSQSQATRKAEQQYYKMAPPTASIKLGEATPQKKTAKNPSFNSKVADAILNQLTVASMVFGLSSNTSNVEEHIKAQLIIDPSKTPKELSKKLTLPENVTTTQTKITISKIVSAKIVAPDFTVIPLTPEQQGVASTEPTEWDWELIPQKPGKFNVHLTISAVVTIDNLSTERFIKTFDEDVEVVITPKQIAKSWITKYWQWFMTALVIPLGVFLWKNRKRD